MWHDSTAVRHKEAVARERTARQQGDTERTAARPRRRAGVPRSTLGLPRLLGHGAAALAVILLLGATLLFTRPAPVTVRASCAARGITTGLAAGQCAPNFTLDDVQGRSVSLAQFRGHPILLHFWAVACPTCAAEYPAFARAVRTDVPKDLTVLAVDAWGETASLVQQWQARHRLPATLLIDPPQAIVRAYNVPGTPTSVFIDRTGRIVSSAAGPLTYADFQRNISRIL